MENSRGEKDETEDEHDPDDREQQKRADKLCARETHKSREPIERPSIVNRE
jgi:hypothetical protein